MDVIDDIFFDSFGNMYFTAKLKLLFSNPYNPDF